MREIVAATDLSAPSLVGFEQALRIGRLTGARVVALHAGGVDEKHQILSATQRFESALAAMPTHRRAEFDAIVARYSDVQLKMMAIAPKPKPGIPDFAAEVGADLVVVGSRGHSGVKRFLLGSIAESVVRTTTTNVMVARADDGEHDSFRKILVPTDFSEPAARALDTAVGLADVDTHIDVLHCWQVPYRSLGEWGPIPESASIDPGRRHERRRSAVEACERAVEPYGHALGARIACHESEGQPHLAILSELEKGDYDLVVMGSTGRRGLTRLIVGNTAEMIVRYARCSVMTVHGNPGEDRSKSGGLRWL